MKLTTLSRVISITLKSRTSKRLLFLLTLLSLLLLPLRAEEWRYVVAGEDEGYSALVEDALGTVPFVSNPLVLEKAHIRAEEKSRTAMEAKKALLYSKEDFKGAEKTEAEKIEPFSSLEMKKVDLDLSKYMALLSRSDSDALHHISLSNDLDAIFFVKAESEGNIRRIELFMNGEPIRNCYYSSDLSSYEERQLVSLFSSLLLGDEGEIYNLVLSPSSATVAVDGEKRSSSSPYILLENGKHTFTLSAYGYQDQTFELDLDGSEKTISLSLEKSPSFGLFVTSLPWTGEIWLNGIKTEGKYITDVDAPYVLTLRREGYAPASFQTSSSSPVREVTMKPIWTEDKDILKEKKNDFYRSTLIALLSFGGYTASGALEKIGGVPYQDTAKVVLGGISIVSLVNLVRSAADYYGYAGLGI